VNHDFDAQREDTISVWNDLSSRQSLPDTATLQLQFVPAGTSADWDAFKARLSAAGYDSERYDDEEGETLEASIGPIELGADEIWKHEMVTTTLAIECGFEPDGWGFFSN